MFPVAVGAIVLGAAVLIGATYLDERADRIKQVRVDADHAPLLERTQAWQESRDHQGRRADWGNSGSTQGRHRRGQVDLIPAPAVGVSAPAAGVKVSPPNSAADAHRILTDVLACPSGLPSPGSPPSFEDIDRINRELTEWVADPNRTGSLPRVQA